MVNGEVVQVGVIFNTIRKRGVGLENAPRLMRRGNNNEFRGGDRKW